jgi:hypothetical protein
MGHSFHDVVLCGSIKFRSDWGGNSDTHGSTNSDTHGSTNSDTYGSTNSDTHGSTNSDTRGSYCTGNSSTHGARGPFGTAGLSFSRRGPPFGQHARPAVRPRAAW